MIFVSYKLLPVVTASVLALTGCAPARQSVSLDAPKLAFALMFVGVCAVLCSLIGGFALVRSTKNRRKDN